MRGRNRRWRKPVPVLSRTAVSDVKLFKPQPDVKIVAEQVEDVGAHSRDIG
jgi:hypothetical protein